MEWLIKKTRELIVIPIRDFIHEYNTIRIELKESSGGHVETINLRFLPPLHSNIILNDTNRRFYVEGMEVLHNGTTIILYGKLTYAPVNGTAI